VDSTNAEAKRRAGAGAPHGTVIIARRQTAGYGRRGRPWISGEGNVTASALLKPPVPSRHAGQLGLLAGLAVAEALAECRELVAGVDLKWPNDVLVRGRKVAGVLLESQIQHGRLDWVVVGVGVNVIDHPEDMPFPATDLRAEGARDATAEGVTQSLLRRLGARYDQWMTEGFDDIRAAWLARAVGFGALAEIRLEGESFTARLCDLGSDGALIVETAEGRRREIATGEIYWPMTAG
jgi:BirA family biotin operon repressor/biotin-[acetyl-CoA-carboxylase] ligase